MRLTVTICCILNLYFTSYGVSAGYSDMVLNGPLPKLEDHSDDDRGTNKEQRSEYGEGENGQRTASSVNQYGGFKGQRDVQERERSIVQQKKVKSAGTEGQIVFGRKRLGRFEFEDGERYEESGDSGDGRERNWYSGKGDKQPQDNGEVKEGDHPLAENQQHRGNNYTHRRQKNYTQLQRSQRVVGNKVNLGDLSRFRKIHRKHFGGGENGGAAGEGNAGNAGPAKPKFNSGSYNNQRRVKKLRLEEESESINE